MDKEGEVKDYSQMEKKFLQITVSGIRQREDGMIEVPLPFKTDRPTFAWNKGVARSRTETTLKHLESGDACKQFEEIQQESGSSVSAIHSVPTTAAASTGRIRILNSAILGMAEREGQNSL